ncbi:MAG TPA: YigZ family protein [Chitinophagaceae bacterium]|nr:YigZ family protein [Chitinophagaceae bacterium]
MSNSNKNKDFYLTIEKESFAEFKDRGSRFLGYAFPLASADDFKRRLRQLKEEHPKAAHHCFAYRIGTDGNNFRSSDDGEPSGSAGRPILGQIDSRELSNTAIIVVRYFGGTLLGVPGLINAYKTSASFALQVNPVIKKPVLIDYRLQFDYTILNEVMRIIKKNDCIILKQELQLFCMIETSIPKKNLELCILQLKNLKSMELSAI